MRSNIFLLFLLSATLHFFNVQAQDCTLKAPTGLYASEISSCSVTFHWKQVSGAVNYKVKYRKLSSSLWSQLFNADADTFYTFSNLSVNTKYEFAVRAICPNEAKSNFSSARALTSLCTLPTSAEISILPSGKARIVISSSCTNSIIYYRYKTFISDWTTLSATNPDSLMLSNLLNNTSYIFQVSTCSNQSQWTPADTFLYPGQPNIILILLDDARFDAYSCNGAPSFMQTPSIDRIAHEGINFKNSFVVQSLCAPSRTVIATGNYAVRNGVFDNISQQNLNTSLPLLPEILHSNGYSTALVGKNHDIFDYQEGYFDYWFMWKSSSGNSFAHYQYFEKSKTIPGYDTDVLTDSAVGFICRSNGPYFLWLAYHAPHTPLIPAAKYDHVFDNEVMPLGIDSARFTHNFPSFLDSLDKADADATTACNNLRETFEMMLSVEDGIGKILNTLDSLGQTDNTMIIFSSDNGRMHGEHHFDAKRLAYEESIRVPLFIRYPSWFAPGSVDSTNIALNIDYAPTILKAAGITDSIAMDGLSLKNIFDGTNSRSTMYYHNWYTNENGWTELAPIYAVRDQHYIYMKYGCSLDTTEEFFDLVNDPLELTNQIKNPAFASFVDTYREKLEELRILYGDTIADHWLDCYLADLWELNRIESFSKDLNLVCYPNPTTGFCTIRNLSHHEFVITEMNELGEVIDRFHLDAENAVTIRNLPTGIYFLVAYFEGESETIKFMVE